MRRNQGLKGLQGLRKWNSLSEKEKETFFEDNPQFRGRSVSEVSQIYDNSQYVAEMGEESFYAHPDKAERDALLKSTLVKRAKEEYIAPFKSLSDDENSEIISKINGLSDDGFIELANSGYKFASQISALDSERKREEKEKDGEKEGTTERFLGKVGKGIVDTVLPTLGRKEKILDKTLESIHKSNKDLLDRVAAKDTEKMRASSSELSNVYNQELGNLSDEDFEKEFSKVYDGESINLGFEGGDHVDFTTSGIGVYKEFKNHHELDNLSRSEQQKMLSDYLAVRDLYGGAAANQMATNYMQNYIHNHQSAWDWWGSALRGATGKTISSFGQLAMGVEAAGNAAWKSAFQGEEASDEWLFNFLQGKDEEGNDRAPINNLAYWNGVDQYGVIPLIDDVFGEGSATKVRYITENGGISPYNWLSEAGHEMNLSSAANEGLKMLGYQAAQFLTARAIGAGGKALAGATGGVFDTATKMYDVAKSSKFANMVMRYGTPGLVSAVNAIPISVGYAKGSADEIYRQAVERADYEAEKSAAADTEQLNAHINKAIGLGKNGFYVSEDSDNPSEDAAIANQLNQWVVNRYDELVKSGARPSDIDVARLYDSAKETYLQYRNLKQVNDYKSGDTYKEMIDAARREAASGYERNASIEFLRMCGVNYLFKQYQQDKSVRAAMNANYPGLGVGKNGEAVGKMFGREVDPKLARWVQPAKTLWGGFESNYMDDVTAAYAKGFSIGRYNDYVDQLVGNPESSSATISWAAGFVNALAQAEGAFTDKQSWYDGFIGALGSGMVVFPGTAARSIFSKSGRSGLSEKFNYSTGQMAAIANKYGLTLEEYINGEFEKYVERTTKGLSDVQIKERANELRRKDGLDAAIEDGRVERTSFAEKLNKVVYNPLLAQYEESAERERVFKSVVDGGDKAIASKKEAIEDLIKAAIVSNRKAEADASDNVHEGKEAKARQAFALVSTLSKWMRDPIMSQSEFVQESWAAIERMADKSKITASDVDAFFMNVENRSEIGREDAEEFARERLNSNAKQLLAMRDAYEEATSSVRKAKDFRVIASHGAADDVVETLAFSKSMNGARKRRMHEMAQETGVHEYRSMEMSPLVEFGSKKGAEDYVDFAMEQKKQLEEERTKLEALIGKKRGKNTSRSMHRLRRRGYQLALKEVERQNDELDEKIRSAKEAIENEGLFDSTLSKDDILQLNAVELAHMIDDRSSRLYSKEQQREIELAKQELLKRNPDALEKVRDMATLQEAIIDTERAETVMQQNLEAAADYYAYARMQRAANLENALIMHHYRQVENAIEDAETNDLRTIYAKNLSSRMLDRYMKDHPEREALLKDIKDMAKLNDDIRVALRDVALDQKAAIRERVRDDGKADTSEDVERKNEEEKMVDSIAEAVKEAILGKADASGRLVEFGLYYDPKVTSEQALMGEIEELADRTTDPKVKAFYEELLSNLEKAKHSRNATVVQKRVDKEAEKKKREEYNRKQDGANFGWDGFKVGDVVYHKDGRKGEVKGFAPPTGSSKVGSIKIRWDGDGSKLTIYTGDNGKSNILKEAPANPVQTPAPAPTPAPTSNAAEEEILGEDMDVFTEDGEYIPPTSQEELERVLSESEQAPLEVTYASAVDEANKEEGQKNYREGEGLLEGNGFYEYDVARLKGLGIIERRASKEEGDTLSKFFKWLDNEGIQLQEIIDRVLSRIYQMNPDAKIQFMTTNDPLVSNHVIQVMEFKGDVERVYNEVESETGLKLGGVVVATDGTEEKRYLVVGTTYSHIGPQAYYAIANRLKGHSDVKYYVHPKMHTKIAKMDAGRLISRQKGEGEVRYRTIGELFEDPSRNPSGITFEDAVLGIMYEDKFFVPNHYPAATMFPPGKSDATLGNVFLMIPAANGNYIPVALKTETKLNSPELVRGALTERIAGLLDSMTSMNIDERRAAVVELGKILKFESINREVQTGFLVGNEHSDTLTMMFNGVKIKTWTLGAAFDRMDFMTTVMSMPFEINVTQAVIQSPSKLREYDEAGILRTDVSTLRTGNVAYQVFPVDASGSPMDIEVRKAVPQSRKLGTSRASTSTPPIKGIKYRVVDGQYYDEYRHLVTDPNVKKDIYYNLVIQQNALRPSYKSSQTGKEYFIIVNNADNPTIVGRNAEKEIEVLSPQRAIRLMAIIREQEAALERARAAEEELKRIEQGKQEVDGEFVDGELVPQSPKPQAQKKFIEPAHDDSVTYGPAIRVGKVHDKHARKDVDVEFHTKIDVDLSGDRIITIVGWDETGREWRGDWGTRDGISIEVPDGFALPDGSWKSSQIVVITKLYEKTDGTVKAELRYGDANSYSSGWTTLERVSPEAPKPQQPVQPQAPQQAPAEKSSAPESDFNPNAATTKTLEELQKEDKVVTFGSLYAKRRNELNSLAKEKGWNWGKSREEKEAFIRKKFEEHGIEVPDFNAINDVDTFIANLKGCL